MIRKRQPTRSFCYITDTITRLILLTSNEEAKGEVVNVGNPQEITTLQLAGKIKELAKQIGLNFSFITQRRPKRMMLKHRQNREASGVEAKK